MKTHTIFPTVISEGFFEDNATIKELVLNTYFEKCDENGYSNENTGHVDLHHDTRYEDLYRRITDAVQIHLASLAIMPGIFDVNIVKSWFNVIREKNTPLHNHGDAHFSFVYYVNIPEDVQKPLVFHNNRPSINEPHTAFYANNVYEWNHLNAYTWSLQPTEGTLYVFPSRLDHETSGTIDNSIVGNTPNFTREDLLTKRICIAGDVILTYGNKSRNPTGIQPISNWKTFTSD